MHGQSKWKMGVAFVVVCAMLFWATAGPATGDGESAIAENRDTERPHAPPQVDESPIEAIAKSLISNGGFERRASGTPPAYIESLQPGNLDLAGWEIVDGSIDWIGPARWSAARGECCLDIDAPGTIRQVVKTIPGQEYVLQFRMAGNVETEPALKHLNVQIGSLRRTFSWNATGFTRGNLGWTTRRLAFRAESESTPLAFSNGSTEPTASGVALDEVSIFPLAGGTLNLGTASPGSPTDAESHGRYTLAAVSERLVLLDSATGRTWILTDKEGGPFWKPIEMVVADPSDAAESKPNSAPPAPTVQIDTAVRTMFAEVPMAAFSCEVCNHEDRPIWFLGYTPGSFGPPLPEGECAPMYVVQLKSNGQWQDDPIGWCGTGLDHIQLAGRTRAKFSFAVPQGESWESVRVGVRWFPDHPGEQANQGIIAWSEPFGQDRLAGE